MHECYMEQALALAREAAQAGEVPVGCVIVRAGVVVVPACGGWDMVAADLWRHRPVRAHMVL